MGPRACGARGGTAALGLDPKGFVTCHDASGGRLLLFTKDAVRIYRLRGWRRTKHALNYEFFVGELFSEVEWDQLTWKGYEPLTAQSEPRAPICTPGNSDDRRPARGGEAGVARARPLPSGVPARALVTRLPSSSAVIAE